MPTKTLGPLCKQYEAKMKDLKLSTQPSIFKRFTQSGWRGNELLPGVVDFLCHRLAVMLLLGRNYKHPVGEVPGKHDLTFGGRGEESDSENGSGDDDTITGTKRKSKTGRKTRNNFRKVEECSLTSALQSTGQQQLQMAREAQAETLNEARAARAEREHRYDAQEAVRKREREEDRCDRAAAAEAAETARRTLAEEEALRRKDEIAILQLQLKLANAGGKA